MSTKNGTLYLQSKLKNSTIIIYNTILVVECVDGDK